MTNAATPRITRIWAKNYRSIADSSLELGPVTILVGPNGAGKSNLLDVVAFLSDALRTNLDTALSVREGIQSLRMREGEPSGVEVGVQYETGGLRTDYDFRVEENADGGCRVARERIEFGLSNDWKFGHIEFRNGNWASSMGLDGITDFPSDNLAMPAIRQRRPQILWAALGGDAGVRWSDSGLNGLQYLTQPRVYRLFPNAMRQPQRVRNPRPLESDGGNLGATLRELARKRPDSMGRIKEALHHVIPFVTDLRVVAAGGFLVTQLKHGDVSVKDEEDAWFDLTQESDGTVRLLGILTALYQQPYLPLIGIEEPELNVHPGAMAALGDAIREASRRSQVLITTHSPDLIDWFQVENIVVVDSERGITTADSVSEIQIETVRENLFSPGELHRMEGLKPAGRAR